MFALDWTYLAVTSNVHYCATGVYMQWFMSQPRLEKLTVASWLAYYVKSPPSTAECVAAAFPGACFTYKW
eukprot:6527446-Pyramimonas_sp.AAC.2